MLQDIETTIKREFEDEPNEIDQANEIPLKKPRFPDIQIKEEQVELDADEKCSASLANNADEKCQSEKKNVNTNECNLQIQNPLEDLFWVQDGLYFEEQDPNSLEDNNFPTITENPTTSTGTSAGYENNAHQGSKEVASNQEQNDESSYNQDLLTFLQNDTEGKGVLTVYEKNNCLTAAARRTLVHLIVQREKVEALKYAKPGEVIKDWDVRSARWIKLAQEVENIFKSELKEVFYSPFRKENQSKTVATGKLVDRFYYVKRVMREQGILASFHKRKKKENAQENQQLEESQEDDLNFLVNNSEPFLKVKEIFERTRNVRRNISKWKSISILEYVLSIKALRLDEPGQILIHMDFDAQYKDKKSKLFDKWPKIRDHLMDALRLEVKGVTPNEFNYIALLKSMNCEQQDIMIFYLLHHLTINVQCRRKKKNNKIQIHNAVLRKLTSDEKRQSYLLNVLKIGDLKPSVEKLKEWLKSRELPFEPITVIVGPLLNIESFHVVVDDIIYTTKTFLEAVDLNFKIFYVFNRGYPPYVDDLWKFIQNVIYEIPLVGEKMSMQHKLLGGKIEMLCKS